MVRESRHTGRRRLTGLVAVLLAVSGVAHAQIHVDLSTRHLAVGERLSYVIQIDYEEPADVAIPEIDQSGFRLADGPNIQPATRFSAEQRSRVVEVSLGLEAVQAGRYVLNSIPISVAGQIFRTPEVLVEVGERGARDVVPFLARWEVPGGPFTAGESRAVYLTIYNADEFIYPDSLDVTRPEQAIFEQVQGLGRNSQRFIDGVTLYEIPVAVFMATPSAAGSLDLAPASIEWEDLRAVAPALTIPVVEAPAQIASTGAVGYFDLSVALEPHVLAATEASTLTLRLEGTGNLHYLQIPAITLEGLVVESEERMDRFAPVDNGYTGYIQVEYVLRPTATGEARVTVDEFAFADPRTGRTSRLQVRELAIQVTPVKEPMVAPDSGITFDLLRADEISAIEPANWHANPLSYGIFVPGLLVFLVIRIWKRKGNGAALVSLVALFLVAAQTVDLPWTRISAGLTMYDMGNTEGAIYAFEDAAQAATDSPGIQHNLAVLYYQQGDVGRSVFAAREAVRLNPAARQVRDTLALIEQEAGLVSSPSSRHVFHPDQVFIALAVAANVFFALIAFSGRARPKKRSALLAIGQILSAVIVVAFAVGMIVTVTSYGRQVGVVMNEQPLRRIPSAQAESWLTLEGGTAVDVVAQNSEYVLVRTDSGLEGWAPISLILWNDNPALEDLRRIFPVR